MLLQKKQQKRETYLYTYANVMNVFKNATEKNEIKCIFLNS